MIQLRLKSCTHAIYCENYYDHNPVQNKKCDVFLAHSSADLDSGNKSLLPALGRNPTVGISARHR